MIEYKETESGTHIAEGNRTILVGDNPHYKRVLGEVESGTAVIVPFDIEAHNAALVQQNALSELTETDKDMARITEDLIDTLVSLSVMTEDDLPASAKAKLANRRAKRDAIG